MSARTRRSEAGFTLIELLVAVSLMGLLMTALIERRHRGLPQHARHAHEPRPEQRRTDHHDLRHEGHPGRRCGRLPPATLCGGETPKLELTTRSGALVTSPVVKVRYALRANGELLRCNDAISSTIARDVTDFTVSGTDTVATTVKTAAGTEVPAYQFSFEVRRRQA